VVACDEASVRVIKKTRWEWVFVTTIATLHIIIPSRGADVVRHLFGDMRLGVRQPGQPARPCWALADVLGASAARHLRNL